MSVTQHDRRDGLPEVVAGDVAEPAEIAADGDVIEPGQPVTGTEFGAGRGRVGIDCGDHGAIPDDGDAVDQKHPAEDRDRQDEIHRRTGDQDDDALPWGRLRQPADAGDGVAIAGEADKSAERQPVDGVADTVASEEREGPRRVADAEFFDGDAEANGREEVAELVYDDEDTEHRQECGDGRERPDHRIDHACAPCCPVARPPAGTPESYAASVPDRFTRCQTGSRAGPGRGSRRAGEASACDGPAPLAWHATARVRAGHSVMQHLRMASPMVRRRRQDHVNAISGGGSGQGLQAR